MDQIALSSRMKRLYAWLDDRCQPEGFIRRHFRGAPCGEGYVTIDRDRQGPAASFNLNRVYLCGAEPGLQPEGLDRFVDLFTAAGVKRFFVWLGPGPGIDAVRDWLSAGGFSRVAWTGYPTLVHENSDTIPFQTDLTIREITAEDVAQYRDRLGETMWPEYARSAGRKGFCHYMAFDGERPVATAALCAFEDLGYLTMASTCEGDRRRGAQQALIARRVERAREIGCSIIVSETLTMLKESCRNLERAGFRTVYDKEVYVRQV